MSTVKLVLVRLKKGTVNGLRARFYAWSGESPPDPSIPERQAPIYETIHENIEFVWDDSPAPGVPPERYMVEWSGFLSIPVAGVYRLYVIVDDGAKVWLDDRLVIDAWRDQPPTLYLSEPLELDVGFHKLRVLYYNFDVFAKIVLGWVKPDGSYEVIPREHLYTRLGENIVIRGVPKGYEVEVKNGVFTRRAKAEYGIVEIPWGDVNSPIPAYFRVYDEKGRIVVESPVIEDVWGGDEYILLARS